MTRNRRPCGHSYTTLQGRTFVCDKDPHPTQPDVHYFIRKPGDPEPPVVRQRTASRLVRMPGERRG